MLTLGIHSPVISFGAMDVDDNSSDEFEKYCNDLDNPSENTEMFRRYMQENSSKNKMDEPKDTGIRKPHGFSAHKGEQADIQTDESDEEYVGFNALFTASEPNVTDRLKSDNTNNDGHEHFLEEFRGLFDETEGTQPHGNTPKVSTEQTDAADDSDSDLDIFNLNVFGDSDSDSEDEIHETSSRARLIKYNQKRQQAEVKHQQQLCSGITSKTKVAWTHNTNKPNADGKLDKCSDVTESNNMSKSPVVAKPANAVSKTTAASGTTSKGTADDDDDDFCCICLDEFSDPKVLHKCSHKFCTECIDQQFRVKPVCPVCFVAYGVVTGNQPEGWMRHSINKTRLPGYENTNCIIVSYGFDDGIQTEEHPNPGVPYYGTSRSGYLPNNDEGRKVLRLLEVAFKRRLVFTVGRSRTTGADNVVTWNDIHHKTSPTGGQQSFGYPDPTYLQRVQEELAAFGVTEESLNETDK